MKKEKVAEERGFPDDCIEEIDGNSFGCERHLSWVCVCRLHIRSALNQQTAVQFQQYAQQQFPNNPQQVRFRQPFVVAEISNPT